jgi:uncharacterized LabA/DUF88 family protein
LEAPDRDAVRTSHIELTKMAILSPEIYLADGENLVARFQAMKAEGRKVRPEVVHVPDVVVWTPTLFASVIGDVRRIAYYTSVVGDDAYLASIEKQIRSFVYKCGDGQISRTQFVQPRVFKKPSRSAKSRSVDINIVIDSLRYARGQAIGLVGILSGDGDFAPLAQELIHAGVQVEIFAFSSGLSPLLERSADDFMCLDDKFFEMLPDQVRKVGNAQENNAPLAGG